MRKLSLWLFGKTQKELLEDFIISNYIELVKLSKDVEEKTSN
jgi:hypothetical protein